jgi:hypothetical protein
MPRGRRSPRAIRLDAPRRGKDAAMEERDTSEEFASEEAATGGADSPEEAIDVDEDAAPSDPSEKPDKSDGDSDDAD